jgi:hypothetical protein
MVAATSFEFWGMEPLVAFFLVTFVAGTILLTVGLVLVVIDHRRAGSETAVATARDAAEAANTTAKWLETVMTDKCVDELARSLVSLGDGMRQLPRAAMDLNAAVTTWTDRRPALPAELQRRLQETVTRPATPEELAQLLSEIEAALTHPVPEPQGAQPDRPGVGGTPTSAGPLAAADVASETVTAVGGLVKAMIESVPKLARSAQLVTFGLSSLTLSGVAAVILYAVEGHG